ncbi:hypothetical protein TeGR_g583, partial [Tetraparma gracilis]
MVLVGDVDAIKTQLAILVAALLLTVDAVNPVKIFLTVFEPLLGITTFHLSTIYMSLITYIFFTEINEILYFSVKIFFHSILSIFFSQVEIIGMDNIPRNGPVIFVGNHANQFVDGIMLMMTAQHKVSFLVAEKSWYRPIIGHFAYAMGAVPVARAQDKSKKGSGSFKLTASRRASDAPAPADGAAAAKATTTTVTVSGSGTAFSDELRVGDKCRVAGSDVGLKVVRIQSDEALELEVPLDRKEFLADTTTEHKFDILERVDQSTVYNKVLNKLEKGGCIGIFPEGGSHDRTELLPLKVGVALIAYTAFEKRGMNIPIVPVGLNYFQAHRFRGKAIVEYGAPIFLKPETLPQYQAGGDEKRAVCNELLAHITDGMRSVLVTTPDYETLKHIHAARRLWKRYNTDDTQKKQDMTRRFSFGLQQLMAKFGDKIPPELQ